MTFRGALLATSLLLAAPVLVACDDDGPAEQAGEKMDDALNTNDSTMENAGEKMDEAADDMHDAIEDVAPEKE
ncbi:MAG: hypothetical protein GC184_03285 [Rhizobiales bacterium]|nr:hypothetical protein [Hyphomicrobiales bacterium]